MQKSWATFRAQIGRKVNDPSLQKYSDAITDNMNDALRLLASTHTGVASISTITGDGSTTAFSLPSNTIESDDQASIQGVYDSTADVWLKKVDFFPGENLEDGYYVWPSGTINFSPAIPEDREIKVHYVAYYDEVADDESVLDIPGWAYEAVKLYTAGRVLEDPVSQLSLLANFRTRVDSGNPEHSPILKLSKYYIQQFWDILNAHPAPQHDKFQ